VVNVNLVNDHVVVANRLRPVLLRLHRELRREVRDLGITPGQASLLAAISLEPGIGVRGLAAREGMSPAGMSGHVDRLEAAGLVRRTPSDSDRRRVGLELTEQGRRLVKAAKRRRTAWLASRLKTLTPEQIEAVDQAVEPLAKLLEERR
jgi:DNA-binding MarR family transcriptional regulator